MKGKIKNIIATIKTLRKITNIQTKKQQDSWYMIIERQHTLKWLRDPKIMICITKITCHLIISLNQSSIT